MMKPSQKELIQSKKGIEKQASPPKEVADTRFFIDRNTRIIRKCYLCKHLQKPCYCACKHCPQAGPNAKAKIRLNDKCYGCTYRVLGKKCMVICMKDLMEDHRKRWKSRYKNK